VYAAQEKEKEQQPGHQHLSWPHQLHYHDHDEAPLTHVFEFGTKEPETLIII